MMNIIKSRTITIVITVIIISTVFMASNHVFAASLANIVTTPGADIMDFERAIGVELYSGQRKAEFIYRVDSGLEIGAILNLPTKYNNGFELGPQAKLQLAAEDTNQPAIATGIRNRDIYLVLSKEFKYGFRGHAGVGNGQFENFFIGLNKIINPVQVNISEIDNQQKLNQFRPPVNLMVEYIDKKVNFGLRTNIQKHFYVELGIIDFESFKGGVSFVF